MKLMVLLAMVFPLVACSGGPMMEPGNDCMSCHAHSGNGSHAWTVAGTVFPSNSSTADQGIAGVTVLITDASGRMVSLESNGAGNFYTNEPLAMPLKQISVEQNGEQVTMPMEATTGACNSCHTPGGEALGRLYAPQ